RSRRPRRRPRPAGQPGGGACGGAPGGAARGRSRWGRCGRGKTWGWEVTACLLFLQLARFGHSRNELLKTRDHGLDAKRRARQPGSRIRVVVAARRHVVRAVRMEERGEQLDLAAADPELELAAAVEHDPALLGVVVEVEEPLERAEARRLDVERPRRE